MSSIGGGDCGDAAGHSGHHNRTGVFYCVHKVIGDQHFFHGLNDFTSEVVVALVGTV